MGLPGASCHCLATLAGRHPGLAAARCTLMSPGQSTEAQCDIMCGNYTSLCDKMPVCGCDTPTGSPGVTCYSSRLCHVSAKLHDSTPRHGRGGEIILFVMHLLQSYNARIRIVQPNSLVQFQKFESEW